MSSPRISLFLAISTTVLLGAAVYHHLSLSGLIPSRAEARAAEICGTTKGCKRSRAEIRPGQGRKLEYWVVFVMAQKPTKETLDRWRVGIGVPYAAVGVPVNVTYELDTTPPSAPNSAVKAKRA